MKIAYVYRYLFSAGGLLAGAFLLSACATDKPAATTRNEAKLVGNLKEKRLYYAPINQPNSAPISDGDELQFAFSVWSVPAQLIDANIDNIPEKQIDPDLWAPEQFNAAQTEFFNNPLRYINRDDVRFDAPPVLKNKAFSITKSGINREIAEIKPALFIKYPDEFNENGTPKTWKETPLGWEFCTTTGLIVDSKILTDFSFRRTSLVGWASEKKHATGRGRTYSELNLQNRELELPEKAKIPVFNQLEIQTQIMFTPGKSTPVANSFSNRPILSDEKQNPSETYYNFFILTVTRVATPAPAK